MRIKAIQTHFLCLFASLLSLLRCQQLGILQGTHQFPARFHRVQVQQQSRVRIEVKPQGSSVTVYRNQIVERLRQEYFLDNIFKKGSVVYNRGGADFYFKVQPPIGQFYYQLKVFINNRKMHTFKSFIPPLGFQDSNYVSYRVRKSPYARCDLVLEYFEYFTSYESIWVTAYPSMDVLNVENYPPTRIQINYTTPLDSEDYSGFFIVDYNNQYQDIIRSINFTLSVPNPEQCVLQWGSYFDSYTVQDVFIKEEEQNGSSSNPAVYIAPTVVGVFLVIILIICCWCRRRKGDDSDPDNTANNLDRGVVSSENINQPNYQPSQPYQPYQPYQLSQPYQPHQPYQPYFDPKIEVSEAKFSKTFEGIKTSCSICLDEKCNVQLKCKHYFHYKCITQWMRKNNLCPICRKKVEF